MSCEVYAVADSAHFPGAVAMVNSLRGTGYHGDIIVGDIGLEAAERRILEAQVQVEPVARQRGPQQLKTVLPRRSTAAVRVLIDADIVMMRPLGAVIDDRRAPLLAFVDAVADRFRPEWADLGLGIPEPGVYVNSGFLVLGGPLAFEMLDLVHDAQTLLDPDDFMTGSSTKPFYYADQDVWNAVLCTAGRRTWLDARDARLAPHPPFPGLHEGGAGGLRYADGEEPALLHHVGPKPWLRATAANAYTREFARLVSGGVGPIRLDPARLPVRFRRGWRSRVARGWAAARAGVHARRGRLGVRRRLAARSAAGGGP